MSSEPLVSVVIPFYSGKEWLVEAIESVINQNYRNLEIIVVNDGSNENVDDVKKNYGSSVKFIYKENGGPASARNLGIKESKGKYIAFLDSDDIWLPKKLTEQIGKMEKEGYSWSHHSYEMFWDNSDKKKTINTNIYNGNIFKHCLISLRIQTSCVVVLRKVLIDEDIYFPIDRRYGQDHVFFRKIAKKYPIMYVDGVFSKFRIRGTNAGFRAEVQIHDRAFLWEEIKKDKDALKSIPFTIILAYKAVNFSSKIIRLTKKSLFKNKDKKYMESLSRILYLFPYIIFQIYAKTLEKQRVF